ncbi:MAG: sugar-transfer associated ATP-grasp domain-containing protein, partial [Halovenus sp.]
AKRLLATLVAIVFCYAVLTTESLVQWFVSNPITWGAAIVGVAYVGSRPGFRLSELLRFSGHYDGRMGPLSVAITRFGYQLRRIGWWIGDRLGVDVDAPSTSQTEVLAMKRRNKYIETYNPPRVRPTADEKAIANSRLTGLGIPSPETYAVIDGTGELNAAERIIAEHDEFVIKPSQGYGGEGIVVVTGRDGDTYETSQGSMTATELRGHVRRIVDGHHSGLDSQGTAILEAKLTPAQFMRDLHGDGVADIRVIVFQGYPVMAMTRLPTEASEGAANLHLGAVGVGLSLADGTPLGAYQQSEDRELDAHPDTGASLTDFQMPNWEGILQTAVEAASASGLGYTGVDVVLAEDEQPKVLEVNVRPGLGIQNTTGRGIFERLEFVEALPPEYEFHGPERKIELARRWASEGFDESTLPAEESMTQKPSEITGATTATANRNGPAEAPADAAETDVTSEDADDSEDGSILGRLRRRDTTLGSGLLFVAAWIVGIPILFTLFLLVPVVFLLWLCLQALGVIDEDELAERVAG